MKIENELFKSRVEFIELWKLRSDELYKSASLVWFGGAKNLGIHNGEEQLLFELYRPAMLLIGICLETLLKGLIIKKEKHDFQDGKFPNYLKTHSLEKLLNRVGIKPIDNDELNFIRKLSESIEWISKYPVPTLSAHLKSPKHRAKNVMVRNDKDYERFENLRKRILAEY